MKKLLVGAAAVAVLAFGVLAVGGAATSAQEGDGPIGSFLGKVAEKLGVTEDELKTAMNEAQIETIDEAVAEGRITEEQGDRLKERAEDGGRLFPGFHRPGLFHRGAHFVGDAAAEVLGMSKDDLMAELKDGKSLAEVAEAQGMDVEDFKAALLDQIGKQLDELVADEKLTDEQAEGILQRIEESIDRIVNREGCFGRFGGMRHGPGRFGDGPFAPFDGEPQDKETSGETA